MHRARLDFPAAVPVRVARVPSRIDFIDTCKALGILLVVYAHAPGTSESIKTGISSFHMPLFFFASGYLLSTERISAKPLNTLRHLTRSLLVPYGFFFLVSLGWWLATRGIGQRAQKFAGVHAGDALWGLATGIWSDLFVNIALWFLPCMFFCQLIFVLMRKRFSAGTLLLALTLWALLLLAWTVPWPARLPWGLDIVWVAIVFFACGHWLRAKNVAEDCPPVLGPSALAVLLPLALAGCWLGLLALQGRVDLANANFGPYPLLYLPCALAAVACLVCLSLRIPAWPLTRLLAQHSLAIFTLHVLLIEFLSGLVKLNGLQPLVEAHPLAWSMTSTAWGLATGLVAGLLLMRYLPVLVGQRGQRGLRTQRAAA